MSDFGAVERRNVRPLKTAVSDFHLHRHTSLPSLYVHSFKLFKCPSKDCNKTLSPSMTLSHFITDHRNLSYYNLQPGGKITMDVGAELREFAEVEPNAIRFVQVRMETIVMPLLINVCCLLEPEYPGMKSENPGRWVCLWLSSICSFDNWFSMNLNGKDSPVTAMTKICKPVLSQHSMTTREILADFNVMIVEHRTIEAMCRRGSKLKLDIAMYEK